MEKRKAGTLNKPNEFLAANSFRDKQANIELKCEGKEYYFKEIFELGFVQTLDSKHEQFFSA